MTGIAGKNEYIVNNQNGPENKPVPIKKNVQLTDQNKFYFCLEPTPWVGGWNKVKPKIAILSLNPGIDKKERIFDNSFENSLKRRSYQELWANNLKGNITFADVLFSTVPKNGEAKEFIHLWGEEGREYWIKHLLPLYMEYTTNTKHKFDDDNQKKNFINILLNSNEETIRHDYNDVISFFDKIITIELFPYHSCNGERIELYEDYKDLKNARRAFTRDLIMYLMSEETTFIITRSVKKWKELVPKFDNYKFVSVSNPQNTYITKDNCCIIKGFDDLVKALKNNSKHYPQL
jgi:hypothetical protein